MPKCLFCQSQTSLQVCDPCLASILADRLGPAKGVVLNGSSDVVMGVAEHLPEAKEELEDSDDDSVSDDGEDSDGDPAEWLERVNNLPVLPTSSGIRKRPNASTVSK